MLKIYLRNNLNTLIPWKPQKNLRQLQIVSADGPFIYTQNKRIVDFTSGAMVVNVGHGNQHILDTIKNHTLNGISYVPSNFSTFEREKLSDRLLHSINYYKGKVFYCNAGGDANEIACFLSKEYHFHNSNQKNRILAFEKSFHGGSTMGSSVLSGDKRRIEKLHNLPLEPIMENPSLEDNGNSSLLQIEKLLDSDNNISSIIVEGSSGSAGCILYPRDYLKKLENICRKRNILIICDEVMSGFGRTGKIFAHQGLFKPDIITCEAYYKWILSVRCYNNK